MAFDFTVQKRNSKGQIVSEQPYRMVISEGKTQIERPPGSGYWYDAGGTLIKEPAKQETAKQEAEAKLFKQEAKK